MSIAVGAATSIRQPLEAAFLIAIENLVTGLPSNSKFPAKFRHRLATNCSLSVIIPGNSMKGDLSPCYRV